MLQGPLGLFNEYLILPAVRLNIIATHNMLSLSMFYTSTL
jgi:hypothetical protein